jgi:carboxylesterase type B
MYLTVPTHLLVLGAAAAVHASSCQTSQPTVKITNGTVVGLTNTTSHIDKFLGIPYAQPPVGDLRLRQALPLNTSFGTLAANNFGPACYGNGNPNPSEDCLTLNIWRPSAAAKQRDNGLAEGSSESLPVFVWLYGGGLMSGYTVI